MKTNYISKLNGFRPCIALLALSAVSAHAATLLVDIQSSGTNTADAPTQSGWNAWELSESFSSTTQSTSFTYADTTGGSLGVSLTPATGAGARNYEVDNVSDPGNLTISDVWFDQYFFNNNTSGTLTVALSNLNAGVYNFTSYHYADNLATSNNDQGTASGFVNTGSGFIDTGNDVTFTAGSGGVTAAQVMSAGTFTTSFTVANDGDAISLRYQDITGGDTFGINGFEVTAVPEPSAALLGALGVLALLRRRRQ